MLLTYMRRDVDVWVQCPAKVQDCHMPQEVVPFEFERGQDADTVQHAQPLQVEREQHHKYRSTHKQKKATNDSTIERRVWEEAERVSERHSRGDAGKRRMGCCARRAKTFHCTVVLLDETEITEDVQEGGSSDRLNKKLSSKQRSLNVAWVSPVYAKRMDAK
ncbi:hypothetical protein CEXT_495281 [Caerostris extrusa]|uniref:Uncharacterized protein n=1 Tax=Caerostris extrusa TaxID=172846 RepID=A0AAV4PH38_CAEEX|nr:hypothetical protein CEXT_495281 [Caerostris extrusa]